VLLAFVMMLTIFNHPKAKSFLWQAFLQEKRMLATSQGFFFCPRKFAKQKVFALG
jgi:hypothetical protein